MRLSRTVQGALALTVSALGFALMAFFVRLCDDFGSPISSFQKSFFRNLIALFIALFTFICAYRRGEIDFSTVRGKPRVQGAILLRSLFGTVGIFGNFYALSRIPIGEAMTLNKTAPFFTVLFSSLFLRERMSFRQILALMTAFVGATLVMKPGFRGLETFATVSALLGGLGAGLAYTCVHYLGQKKVSGSIIIFFFSLFSCLAALPFMLWDYCEMSGAQLLILVGSGCSAAIGQFGVTAAYRLTEPRKIAIFDYSNIIFTSLLGFVFFDQVPDLLSFCGFAVIIGAALILMSARRNMPPCKPGAPNTP